jgi:hypothetical protein
MTTKTKKTTTKTTRRGFGRDSISKPAIILSNHEPYVTAQNNPIEPIPISYGTTMLNPSSPVYTSENSTNFTHVTQIRIDAHLFDSIHNAVESAIFGGDYSIESASHFIREALKDHATGTPLKMAHENGVKKSLSIRINEDLKRFWDTLPKRHRNNILERAIRTKLLSYQH